MSLLRLSTLGCAQNLQVRTTLPRNNKRIESSAAYLLLLRLNRHQAMTRFPLEIGKLAVGSREELMIIVGGLFVIPHVIVDRGAQIIGAGILGHQFCAFVHRL